MMKSWLTLLVTTLAVSACAFNVKAKQNLKVNIKTPSSCEQIKITQVYSEYESALVVAKVFYANKDAMCMTMISNAADSVAVDIAKPKQVKVAVVGKGWCWKNQSENNGYVFVKSEAQLKQLIGDKTQVYNSPLDSKLHFKGFDAAKACR